MSSELDAFLAEVMPLQEAAERAIHDGNVEPRLALWSHQEPVTLFGADLTAVGRDRAAPAFRTVAGWFSDCTKYAFELVAAGASGDLAYTVGYEHSTGTVLDSLRTYTLRVTHVYRRENGAWRIVHRHGDLPPVEEQSPEQAS
jgi:ketosteroid isomerase-like protein